MEIQEQVKLRFKGVDFPTVSLKSFKPYKDTADNKIKIDIQPKVFIPKDNTHEFKILMYVDLVAHECFSLSIIGIGHFELSKIDVTEEVRKSFINANSTAIMFPYIRAFVSLLTSNAGSVMSPIILPTRFFKGELEEVTPEENSENKQIL